MKTILIVEDDPGILLGLSKSLETSKYCVLKATNWSEAEFKINKADIILLDINLPEINGFDICGRIRETYTTPIIFITARDSEIDQLKGYKIGADDYITKPFSIPVLIAKIDSIIKRSTSPNIISFKDILYNTNKMTITKNSIPIKFSSIELKLFDLLINNPGTVLTKEKILERIWGEEPVEGNTLNVTVNRLRKKVEDDYKKPEYIKTLFGIGYYWDA